MSTSRRRSRPRFPLSFPPEEVRSPDVTILGLPLERVLPEYPRGQARSPDTVRRTARGLDFFEPGLGDPLEELELVDEGNAETFEPKTRPDAFLILGGDHTVAPEVASRLRPRRILWLDAHPDLLPSDRHDGALRSCLDHAREAYLVGVRTWSRREREEFERSDRLHLLRPEEALEVVDRVDYVSLDLDVLDPSLAPGVTTPEPGGLGFEEVARIVRAAGRAGAHLDVVELCPTVEDHVTPVVACRLIGEYLKGILEG